MLFISPSPSEGGEGEANAILSTLNISQMNAVEIDYFNAHGSATLMNDISETEAIKKAIKYFAYNIPISATKSMAGHMMVATGALEAIFCLLAIRIGVIPPTIIYETRDLDCDLDYVPNNARNTPIRFALSNAFGFGGNNSVLNFKAYQDNNNLVNMI